MTDINKYNRGRPFDNRDSNPNHRPPRYNDDSDYKTNAPSYYDDLARKQGLMKTLANRIWDYDEELAKRFAAWDKNLEEFDDEVIRLLNEWMDDGTLDDIINENIFNDLHQEINNVLQEVNLTRGFDIRVFKDTVIDNDWTTAINNSIQEVLKNTSGGNVLIPSGIYFYSEDTVFILKFSDCR